ncbi:hypothetical protein [Spirosoma panaciterrae]|uniref:hypothetical protein n=1 Tax=Spirosoma panaciterrae TaxID=496058 RepID=UPI00037D2B62|nr:hypothetical protein [Spirosoma panaciterrae]
MSNSNQLQYFVSQSYRQVQLSVSKGEIPYPYSDFSTQFANLLQASGDEAYARNLTIQLVEEAAQYRQTTDYLRQEMAFEGQAASVSDRTTAVALDQHHDTALVDRRMHRHAPRTNQLVEELV